MLAPGTPEEATYWSFTPYLFLKHGTTSPQFSSLFVCTPTGKTEAIPAGEWPRRGVDLFECACGLVPTKYMDCPR